MSSDEKQEYIDHCPSGFTCYNGGTCMTNENATTSCSCPLSHSGPLCEHLREVFSLQPCSAPHEPCLHGGQCVEEPGAGQPFCLYKAQHIEETFQLASFNTQLCQIKSLDEVNAYNLRLYTIIGILLGTCALVALAVMSLVAVRKRIKHRRARSKKQDVNREDEREPLRKPVLEEASAERAVVTVPARSLPWSHPQHLANTGRSSAPCSVVRLVPHGMLTVTNSTAFEDSEEGRSRLFGTSSTPSDAISILSRSDPSLAGSYGAALRQWLCKRQEETKEEWNYARKISLGRQTRGRGVGESYAIPASPSDSAV